MEGNENELADHLSRLWACGSAPGGVQNQSTATVPNEGVRDGLGDDNDSGEDSDDSTKIYDYARWLNFGVVDLNTMAALVVRRHGRNATVEVDVRTQRSAFAHIIIQRKANRERAARCIQKIAQATILRRARARFFKDFLLDQPVSYFGHTLPPVRIRFRSDIVANERVQMLQNDDVRRIWDGRTRDGDGDRGEERDREEGHVHSTIAPTGDE